MEQDFDFFVIVHADRLGQGAERYEAGSEAYQRTQLIARVLERRIKTTAQRFLDEGKKVYFVGSCPLYLEDVDGIRYFPRNRNNKDEFMIAADTIQADGGRNGLVGGVYQEVCVKEQIRQLDKRHVSCAPDDLLTDAALPLLKKQSLVELERELHKFDELTMREATLIGETRLPLS
jgi:hypothetical protein